MTRMRRRAVPTIAGSLFFGMATWFVDIQSQEAVPPNVGEQSTSVDASSSVESRIDEVPPEIVKMYLGRVAITNHELTSEQEREFTTALEVLTPLQQ